jgi:hypothetical protein
MTEWGTLLAACTPVPMEAAPSINAVTMLFIFMIVSLVIPVFADRSPHTQARSYDGNRKIVSI